jgi:hypothetical protein
MIAKSLNGNYREEHLFALQQPVELFDIYQAKIMECVQAVKKPLEQYAPDDHENPESQNKKKKHRNNEFANSQMKCNFILRESLSNKNSSGYLQSLAVIFCCCNISVFL